MERSGILRLPAEFCRIPNDRNHGADQYTFFLTDTLEKVFPETGAEGGERLSLRCVRGEVPGFQLVYRYVPGRMQSVLKQGFTVSVIGGPCPARLREVRLIPSDYPVSEWYDADYITLEPGLFPDLLVPLEGNAIRPVHHQYRALWIDFPDIPPESSGDYEIVISILPRETSFVMGMHVQPQEPLPPAVELQVYLHIADMKLPPQKTLHTEWFYTDCLANYYGVEVFSERHFSIIDSFMQAAVRMGVNVLLTPVFTPPINTLPGGERTTTQLVGITLQDGVYSFDFSLLERWCALCRKNGITHLEIPHLFTQWGAYATPKVVAHVDGTQRRIFVWDVPAVSPDYRRFLETFLPALRQALHGFGYDDAHLMFHISDEPMARLHWDSYCAARTQVGVLLDGCTILDACSDISFYENGMIPNPVPAADKLGPYLKKRPQNLWVYYCTAQGQQSPNRFFAMPSSRNRVLGLLLYVLEIKGFLHWGYNFYLTEYSEKLVDPFYDTTAGGAFQSGDSFLVYPGDDGIPLSSIRAEVLRDAFDDLRLFQMLEASRGRPFVLAMIERELGYLPDFRQYPRDGMCLLRLHDRAVEEIEQAYGGIEH